MQSKLPVHIVRILQYIVGNVTNFFIYTTVKIITGCIQHSSIFCGDDNKNP